jgi:hypothetical protein
LVSRAREAFQIELPLRAIFEAPTIAELSRRIEALIKSRIPVSAPPITPIPRTGPLPLSFAQQRLWFVDQLVPGNPAFNVPAAMRLEGRLNLYALMESFKRLIARHEILRTRFETINDLPWQRIEASLDFNLALVDLTLLGEDERRIEGERLSTEEAQLPFDLTKLPLMRAKLIRLNEQEHLLLLTMHHIISDGWSRGVLAREIAAFYEAQARGEEANLRELKIQYGDFAHWQREWLSGEVLEEHLGYWRRQLGRGVPELRLPTDYPRPEKQSYGGGIERFEIGEELSGRLRELSREESATIFMTLLAGFKALLQRYSGQAEIVVGADIANRNREETEGLIGFFVNMLVLKSELGGEMSFREVVRKVKEVSIEGYSYQDVPFEKIVEEIQPERGLDRSPMFQVVFVLQNTPMPKLQLPGLALTPVDAKIGGAPFDLIMMVGETDEGLNGSLAYNTDIFKASTIKRMLKDYRKFLEAFAVDPDQPLVNISLVSKEEIEGLSISDFPDSALNQRDFEILLREVEGLTT